MSHCIFALADGHQGGRGRSRIKGGRGMMRGGKNRGRGRGRGDMGDDDNDMDNGVGFCHCCLSLLLQKYK